MVRSRRKGVEWRRKEREAPVKMVEIQEKKKRVRARGRKG